MKFHPDEDEDLDEIMRLDWDALLPVSQAERYKAGLAFARAAYKPNRATLTFFSRAAAKLKNKRKRRQK